MPALFTDLALFADTFVTKFAPAIPFLVLFVSYYFFFYRPQKQAELRFKHALVMVTIGQRVITRGGVVGVIVEILPNSFVIELYDGAKMEIIKEGIATLLHE
jgi:preprotein translocase subunit YajC